MCSVLLFNKDGFLALTKLSFPVRHKWHRFRHKCHLCLTEKLYLVRAKKPSLLNKRTELISKCRHVNKFYLQAANNSSVESLFHT